MLFLQSCEGPSVTFDEPQPADTENLNAFPEKLQGQYENMSNNSTLQIDKTTISKIYDYDIKTSIKQLDSTCKLINDTLIDLETREKAPVKKDGDTLLAHIHSIDTLFSISQTNILKKFKGYYFANSTYGKGDWVVKKLAIHKGELRINSISEKEDIDKLKSISESDIDSVPYQFHPTKRQFKKFLKAEGFSDTEVFEKIK